MWKRLSIAVPHTAGQPTSEMGDSSLTDTTQTSRTARQSITGASLAGIMLSRRFAKRLSTKVFDKRNTLTGSSAGPIHEKEPTYRMEPTFKFNASSVEKVIKQVVESRLSTLRYNPKFCSNITKSLTDEIKDKVKMLGFDRYKIVCLVVIGQANDQALVVSSRCTWDKNHDNYASYSFQTKELVCTATVYGIFRE